VCGRHQTLDEAELVVDNLGEGARESIVHEDLETMSMYDVYLSLLVPNTNMGAWAKGADTFLRVALEVRGGLFFAVKTPCITEVHMHDVIGGGGSNRKRVRTHSRLYGVLDALPTPGNVREVLLGKGGGGLAVGDELAVLGLDGTLEAVVGRIVLKHVCLYTSE